MYEVGREYVNSRGQVVTANSDGSFGNRETGQVMRGSSYNPDVAWYADGADAAMWGAYHNSPVGQVAFKTDQGKTVYTNPAEPVRQSQGGGAGVAGTVFGGSAARSNAPAVSMANRGAFLRDMAWSGKDDPPQDLLMMGYHWKSDPRNTNAELFEARYGDSELAATAYFLMTFGSDVGFNAHSIAREKWGYTNASVPGAIAAAVQPEAVAGAFNAGRNWLTSWADAQKAEEERLQAFEDDFNEAWDAREYYQKQEWDKLHTVLNPANVDISQERLPANVWGY